MSSVSPLSSSSSSSPLLPSLRSSAEQFTTKHKINVISSTNNNTSPVSTSSTITTTSIRPSSAATFFVPPLLSTNKPSSTVLTVESPKQPNNLPESSYRPLYIYLTSPPCFNLISGHTFTLSSANDILVKAEVTPSRAESIIQQLIDADRSFPGLNELIQAIRDIETMDRHKETMEMKLLLQWIRNESELFNWKFHKREAHHLIKLMIQYKLNHSMLIKLLSNIQKLKYNPVTKTVLKFNNFNEFQAEFDSSVAILKVQIQQSWNFIQANYNELAAEITLKMIEDLYMDCDLSLELFRIIQTLQSQSNQSFESPKQYLDLIKQRFQLLKQHNNDIEIQRRQIVELMNETNLIESSGLQLIGNDETNRLIQSLTKFDLSLSQFPHYLRFLASSKRFKPTNKYLSFVDFLNDFPSLFEPLISSIVQIHPLLIPLFNSSFPIDDSVIFQFLNGSRDAIDSLGFNSVLDELRRFHVNKQVFPSILSVVHSINDHLISPNNNHHLRSSSSSVNQAFINGPFVVKIDPPDQRKEEEEQQQLNKLKNKNKNKNSSPTSPTEQPISPMIQTSSSSQSYSPDPNHIRSTSVEEDFSPLYDFDDSDEFSTVDEAAHSPISPSTHHSRHRAQSRSSSHSSSFSPRSPLRNSYHQSSNSYSSLPNRVISLSSSMNSMNSMSSHRSPSSIDRIDEDPTHMALTSRSPSIHSPRHPRNQLFQYLCTCKLFSTRIDGLSLSDYDLDDLLIAAGGDIIQAIKYLQRIDRLNFKFNGFHSCVITVAAQSQASVFKKFYKSSECKIKIADQNSLSSDDLQLIWLNGLLGKSDPACPLIDIAKAIQYEKFTQFSPNQQFYRYETLNDFISDVKIYSTFMKKNDIQISLAKSSFFQPNNKNNSSNSNSSSSSSSNNDSNGNNSSFDLNEWLEKILNIVDNSLYFFLRHLRILAETPNIQISSYSLLTTLITSLHNQLKLEATTGQNQVELDISQLIQQCSIPTSSSSPQKRSSASSSGSSASRLRPSSELETRRTSIFNSLQFPQCSIFSELKDHEEIKLRDSDLDLMYHAGQGVRFTIAIINTLNQNNIKCCNVKELIKLMHESKYEVWLNAINQVIPNPQQRLNMDQLHQLLGITNYHIKQAIRILQQYLAEENNKNHTNNNHNSVPSSNQQFVTSFYQFLEFARQFKSLSSSSSKSKLLEK